MANWGLLAGGLGLILLALSMMTDGLRLAAGDKLTSILRKSTTPAWRGLVSGIAVTAIAQSSSAVTVATIGFVNAGLMNLAESLAVIFGTNIGTTITGWIVAVLGFEIDIAAFALPMIGIGMAAKVFWGEHSRGGFGISLAGLGLFFLGLGFLKATFENIGPSFNFQIVNDLGALGIIVGVLIGFVVTVLAQSSSAAIALVLTAATGGALALPTAAAMVVGANIGTTSTAVIATIGATSNARRVGLAHIIFNLMTGLVAIAILVLSLPLADRITNIGAPATFLALFHTAFNILGVILIWPFRLRLTKFLEGRFRTHDEDERKPRYLDGTLTATPDLAVQALLREVARIDGKISALVTQALADQPPSAVSLRRKAVVVRALVGEVYGYVGQVQQGNMAPLVAAQLAEILRASQYYLEAGDLLLGIGNVREAILALDESQAKRLSSLHVNKIAPAIARDGLSPAPMVATLDPALAQKLEDSYHSLRSALLAAVMKHEVPPAALNSFLEMISILNRLVARIAKASQLLNDMAADLADVKKAKAEVD